MLTCAFSHQAHAQITQIRNYTSCTVEVTLDCYETCIHYSSTSYIVPPGKIEPVLTCPYKVGINDIVATVCYQNGCSSVCAQVDCMPLAAGCGVGTNIDLMPYCTQCIGPSGTTINADYFQTSPSTGILRIW